LSDGPRASFVPTIFSSTGPSRQFAHSTRARDGRIVFLHMTHRLETPFFMQARPYGQVCESRDRWATTSCGPFLPCRRDRLRGSELNPLQIPVSLERAFLEILALNCRSESSRSKEACPRSTMGHLSAGPVIVSVRAGEFVRPNRNRRLGQLFGRRPVEARHRINYRRAQPIRLSCAKAVQKRCPKKCLLLCGSDGGVVSALGRGNEGVAGGTVKRGPENRIAVADSDRATPSRGLMGGASPSVFLFLLLVLR